jgi:tetratricopeptide (TPR) repeat protein
MPDIEAYVREQGLAPELVVQKETLGPRILLRNVHGLDCPTVYWSIDTHLNQWWQRWYGRLFDGVLTTHGHLVEEVKAWGSAQAEACPWFGWLQRSPPFSVRSREAGFVGRITEQRPIRRRLAEMIRTRQGAEVAEGLKFQEMMDFYQDTRVVPNESIMGEVNFRLFEAASCGCLVLCPDLGEQQNALFTPGEEIEVYRDGLELAALLDRARADPAWAERRGRAARARVLREHLFEHRARQVLDFAAGLDRRRARGPEADKSWRLTLLELWLADKVDISASSLEQDLLGLVPDADVSLALVRLFMATGQRDKAMGVLAALLSDQRPAGFQEHAALNLGASMAALRLGQPGMARGFYLRQAAAEKATGEPPSGEAEMLMAWSRVMAGQGVRFQPGSSFSPGEDLPASALQCLLEAHHLEPRNQEVMRRIDAMLAGVKGMEFIRLGFLSWLGLHNRKNWRTALALGALNLQTFRLQEGLDEIVLARDRAREAGQESRFLRALEGRDPRGLLRAALKW